MDEIKKKILVYLIENKNDILYDKSHNFQPYLHNTYTIQILYKMGRKIENALTRELENQFRYKYPS
jgi:hypothetical protein